MNPPEFWFCCISDPHRSVFRVVAEAMLLTLGMGLPPEIWGAAWIASGRDTELDRASFMSVYHLTTGTVIIDGSPFEWIVPVSGFEALWISYGAFLLTPSAACLSGCEQSQRPVM